MASAKTPRSQVLHVSLILSGQLRDADGPRLGRVDDLIVRLGSDDYPPVTGALATIAGRAVFVPAELVTTIASGVVMIRKSPLDLQPFTRRPQEVLLKEDVLDRQLINVDGARLVRTNEIEIARLEGWYRVVGVDTGPRGLFRRLIPRRFAETIQPGVSSTGRASSRSQGMCRRWMGEYADGRVFDDVLAGATVLGTSTLSVLLLGVTLSGRRHGTTIGQ